MFQICGLQNYTSNDTALCFKAEFQAESTCTGVNQHQLPKYKKVRKTITEMKNFKPKIQQLYQN